VTGSICAEDDLGIADAKPKHHATDFSRILERPRSAAWEVSCDPARGKTDVPCASVIAAYSNDGWPGSGRASIRLKTMRHRFPSRS
jgi:hypothetical protein